MINNNITTGASAIGSQAFRNAGIVNFAQPTIIGYAALGGPNVSLNGSNRTVSIGARSNFGASILTPSVSVGTDVMANIPFLSLSSDFVSIGTRANLNTDAATLDPAFNVVVGHRASQGSSSDSTIIGNDAGVVANSSMQSSNIIGHNSFKYAGSGTILQCVAIGNGAFVNPFSSVAGDTTVLGHNAYSAGRFGRAPTAVGRLALANCATGDNNVAFGERAGYNLITGGHNVLLGHQAGATGMNAGDSFNVMMGDETNVFGNSNTVVGAKAFTHTGVTGSILWGTNATTYSATGISQFVIGDEPFYNAVVSAGSPGAFTNALKLKIGNHTFLAPLVAA